MISSARSIARRYIQARSFGSAFAFPAFKASTSVVPVCIVVFVAAALLGMQAEPLNAQSSLDRREANQPILLVDSESPTSSVFALRFVRDGADGLRLLAAGEGKVVWQWQVRQETESRLVSLDPLPRLRWPISRGMRGMISTIASGGARVAESSLVAFCGIGLLPTSVQVQSLKGERALTALHSDELPFLQNSVYGLEFYSSNLFSSPNLFHIHNQNLAFQPLF